MLLARIILGGVLAVAMGCAASAEAMAPTLRFADPSAVPVLRVALVSPPGIAGPILRPLLRPGRVLVQTGALLRPVLRQDILPVARWDDLSGGDDWTRATLAVLATDAAALDDVVPRDIGQWCPAYPDNPPDLRRAFWVGMMSALAQHESTLNPRAVGGGGQWFGLLQIYPPTARLYDCAARTGEELRDPQANLACAARIMAVTVTRDQAVAIHDGHWRGVAADWGPMTSRVKRAEMSAWTREQPYCRRELAVRVALRPQLRPSEPQVDPRSYRLAEL